MAEPQEVTENAPTTLPNAPFPAPPPFWKHFTPANLTRLESLKASNGPDFDLTTLPLELRFLLPPPPPPPSASTYTTFHLTHPTNPSTTLPPIPPDTTLLINPTSSTNIKASLHTLTTSLLLSFLQLTRSLSLDPAAPSIAELLAHIKDLFVNAHVLINSYRPHQAREGVVRMLEERIEDGREEVRRSKELQQRIGEFLSGLEDTAGGGVDGPSNGDANGGVDKEKDEELKRMWRMIREMDQDHEDGDREDEMKD